MTDETKRDEADLTEAAGVPDTATGDADALVEAAQADRALSEPDAEDDDQLDDSDDDDEGDESDDDESDDDGDESDDDEDDEENEEDEAGAARPSRRKARAAALEREGEVAADFLEKLLDIADLDGDIDVDVDGDRAAVAIVDSEEGRVPRRLVGPDGRVLDALQELTRMAVQVVTGERSRLMLDVAGHRAERRRAVVALAQKAIEACKASGEAQPMEAMSAFERKVVHDEVLAAGLSSESEGAEPRRHVVVLPR